MFCFPADITEYFQTAFNELSDTKLLNVNISILARK